MIRPFGLALASLAFAVAPAIAQDKRVDEFKPRPFAAVAADLEKAGWKLKDRPDLPNDGAKITSLQIGDGPEKPLANGRLRETAVVLAPPLQLPADKLTVVRFVANSPDGPRDSITVRFADDDEKDGDFVLDTAPADVYVDAVFDRLPADDSKPFAKEFRPKCVEQDTTPEDPGPLVDAAETFSFDTAADGPCIVVYYQTKLEILDGNRVIGTWYQSHNGPAAFTKKDKNAPAGPP